MRTQTIIVKVVYCNFALPPSLNKLAWLFSDERQSPLAIFTCWQVWWGDNGEKQGFFSQLEKMIELPWQRHKAYIVYPISQHKVKFFNKFSTVMTCTTPLHAQKVPGGLVLRWFRSWCGRTFRQDSVLRNFKWCRWPELVPTLVWVANCCARPWWNIVGAFTDTDKFPPHTRWWLPTQNIHMKVKWGESAEGNVPYSISQ